MFTSAQGRVHTVHKVVRVTGTMRIKAEMVMVMVMVLAMGDGGGDGDGYDDGVGRAHDPHHGDIDDGADDTLLREGR